MTRTRSALFSASILLVLASACEPSTRSEDLSFDKPINRLVVDTGSGDIYVVGDPSLESVEITAVISGRGTELRAELDGDVLRLDHTCPAHFGCAVDWHVNVPSERDDTLGLELDTGSGDVQVYELPANVTAATGSGDIALIEVVGFAFNLDTGSGDVQLTGCEADDLEGEAGSGDVSIELLGAGPNRISFSTGSGDVDLSVPGGSYALELDTGSGDVDVTGVDADAGSDRLIELSTGSGDVNVRGS